MTYSNSSTEILKLVSQTQNTMIEGTSLLSQTEGAYQKLMNRIDLGFIQVPTKMEAWKKTQELADQFKHFKKIALIGIGGSSAGAEAIFKALLPNSDRLVIFDSPSEQDFLRKFSSLNLQETLWYVVSKSGNTLETLFCADVVAQKYTKAGLNWTQHCVVGTELKPSPLYDWAQKSNVPVLEVPKNVGGRFSVLTPVGLFPFAFCGIKIEELRSGALLANSRTELVQRVAASLLKHINEGGQLTYFWFYFSEMNFFRTWLQQLWAESLGKQKNRQGENVHTSVPFVALGPQDQHSIQQQVLDGNFKKACLFFRDFQRAPQVRVEKSLFSGAFWEGTSANIILHCQSEATFRACEEKNIESLQFELDGINERSLGFLIQFFQLIVGTLGEALNTDAFDQPAVEIGKKLTKSLLKATSEVTKA